MTYNFEYAIELAKYDFIEIANKSENEYLKKFVEVIGESLYNETDNEIELHIGKYNPKTKSFSHYMHSVYKGYKTTLEQRKNDILLNIKEVSTDENHTLITLFMNNAQVVCYDEREYTNVTKYTFILSAAISKKKKIDYRIEITVDK